MENQVVSIPVLFQNLHFVMTFKNSGLLTVPSRMGQNDSRGVLGLLLEKQIGKRVFPVHRLDFEVSGLVLFALHPEAHQWANLQFERRRVTKLYQAITLDHCDYSHFPDKVQIDRTDFDPFSKEKWEWSCKILKGKRRSFESEHGQNCLTYAWPIRKQEGRIHWLLNPVTGRSHQLRYELSRHGFPILGDKLYGSQMSYENETSIALRAVKLDLRNCDGRQKFQLPEHFECENLFKTDF